MPVVIPLAWFMMLYPSWVLAVSVLPSKLDFTFGRVIATAAIGSMAMTAWDATQDPTAVDKGEWVWDQPGMYFGIPVHNFAGWLFTTGCVFVFYGAFCSRLRSSRKILPRWYASLPLVAYGFVALARIFISVPPPVRIFAFFSMGLVTTISASRVLLEPAILDNLNHSAGDRGQGEDVAL